RRFTTRGLIGAVAGTVLGMLAVALLPSTEAAGGFLTGLGFSGAAWLWPLIIPPIAAIVAFAATRFAALRMLRRLR
ncbi:MAG: cell division protein FtsX, partial [Thioclava sp.]